MSRGIVWSGWAFLPGDGSTPELFAFKKEAEDRQKYVAQTFAAGGDVIEATLIPVAKP
jgi:hypothetical protein